MKSVSDTILRRIRAKRAGWVFTPKDFMDITTRDTIGVVLHRLLKKGIIRRLSHGLYDLPIKHPKLGTLAPSPEAISLAIANRSGNRIQPSGPQIANQLGLDNQVPAKTNYVTSGRTVRKNVANYPITLKHSKYVTKAPLNPNVINVMNALHYIGKENITESIMQRCKNILSRKDKIQIKKNLKQFPDWIIELILKMDVD